MVLAAVDDSKSAMMVAEEASRIADQKGADVVFLSVVPVPAIAASEGEIDAGYLDMEEKAFQELHKRLIEACFEPGSTILVESKVLHGVPGDKIVSFAEEADADVIVVGTTGKGRLTSALLGSVSSRVKHHSKRQMVVVRSTG